MSATQPELDAGAADMSTRRFPTGARPPKARASGNYVARTVPRRLSEPQSPVHFSAPPPFAPVDPEPPEIEIGPPPPEHVRGGGPKPAVTRPDDESEDDMTTRHLGGRAGIRLAVRVTPEGHLLDSAGTGDGESLGATAAMCGVAVTEAGDALGLGDLEGWVALTDGIAVYCSRQADDLVTCLGDARRTSIGHLGGVIERAAEAGR